MLGLAPHRHGIAVALALGILLPGAVTQSGLFDGPAFAQEPATTRAATREAAVRPQSREALITAYADAMEAGDEAGLRALVATNGPLSERVTDYTVRQHAAAGRMRKALLALGSEEKVEQLIQGFRLPFETPGATIESFRRAAGEGEDAGDENAVVEIDGAMYLDMRMPSRDEETWRGREFDSVLLDLLRMGQDAVFITRWYDFMTQAAREPGVETLDDLGQGMQAAEGTPAAQLVWGRRLLDELRQAKEFARLVREEGVQRNYEGVVNRADETLAELEEGERVVVEQLELLEIRAAVDALINKWLSPLKRAQPGT